MSDNDENVLFEVEETIEESEPSSDEETAPEPEPEPEPEPAPEPEPVQRTKTGRIKKKASPRTKERLRKQLAAGRAKSLEIRRRNKKLKEVSKRKKLDEEDQVLLEELQDRKTNQELRDEIKKLRESMKSNKEPLSTIKESEILPPKPKNNTVAKKKKNYRQLFKGELKATYPTECYFLIKNLKPLNKYIVLIVFKQ